MIVPGYYVIILTLYRKKKLMLKLSQNSINYYFIRVRAVCFSEVKVV